MEKSFKVHGQFSTNSIGGIVLEENSKAEEMSSLFLRGRLRHSWAVALRERLRAKTQVDADAEGRAWKLFGLLLMLLHRPRGTGTVGRDELAARAAKFAAGRWSELIDEACQCETQVRSNAQVVHWTEEERRGRAAQSRFTRQPENSERGHLRVFETPKFHEKTPKRGKKERKLWREREKERFFLGGVQRKGLGFGVQGSGQRFLCTKTEKE